MESQFLTKKLQLGYYLSNRVSNWITNDHQNTHEPHKICTNRESISWTYCLWNNLIQNEYKINHIYRLKYLKNEALKKHNTSPKARTKVTESNTATKGWKILSRDIGRACKNKKIQRIRINRGNAIVSLKNQMTIKI